MVCVFGVFQILKNVPLTCHEKLRVSSSRICCVLDTQNTDWIDFKLKILQNHFLAINDLMLIEKYNILLHPILLPAASDVMHNQGFSTEPF